MGALLELLRGISITNGYSCDMGHEVLWWYDLPQEYRQDGIVVRDNIDTLTEANLRDRHTLQIEIDAYRWAANEPGLIAHATIQDVVKALGSDRTLSGACQQMRITEITTNVQKEGTTVLMVQFAVQIEYTLPLFTV